MFFMMTIPVDALSARASLKLLHCNINRDLSYVNVG